MSLISDRVITAVAAAVEVIPAAVATVAVVVGVTVAVAVVAAVTLPVTEGSTHCRQLENLPLTTRMTVRRLYKTRVEADIDD